MKRIYVALAMLAAVVALCIATHRYQHVQIQRMVDTLDQIEAAYRRGEDTTRAAEQFAEEYQRMSRWISCYVAHSELKESQETAALLPTLMQGRNTDDVLEEITRLRSQLLHLTQVDDPLLWNIL